MKERISKFLSRFNDMIADKLSLGLSSMIAFYVVSALVIIPLFYGTPTSLVAWASYLCSVVFQGIALPVLGYTAKKASDKSDAVILKMQQLLEKIEKEESLVKEEVYEILTIEKNAH